MNWSWLMIKSSSTLSMNCLKKEKGRNSSTDISMQINLSQQKKILLRKTSTEPEIFLNITKMSSRPPLIAFQKLLCPLLAKLISLKRRSRRIRRQRHLIGFRNRRKNRNSQDTILQLSILLPLTSNKLRKNQKVPLVEASRKSIVTFFLPRIFVKRKGQEQHTKKSSKPS